jgi:integrase/recombinase XerD
MKLAEGIELFVARKRESKITYKHPEAMLLHFSRRVGDVRLDEVTTQDIVNYLEPNQTEPYIWHVKYQLLRRLFEYWVFRGMMQPILMPHKRVRVRSTFIPYVYNHAEIRCLLEGTSKSQANVSCALEAKTFRMILLLLFATGMTPAEVVLVKRRDIDFKKRTIAAYEPRSRRSRNLPISKDLCLILRDYLKWRFRSKGDNDFLFVKRSGKVVPTKSIQHYFARLVRLVGVRRRDGGSGWPRMSDFRSSFAVHRIADWLKDGSNMNKMLPALGTYLGQLGASSTERYLRLTPERFRKPLLSLSPQRGRKRWRDDKILMSFLATI